MARFLVIEDNPENLDLMLYLLQAFGHTVEQAKDGERGLAILERTPVDVVICDLQLPGMSGFDVLGRIKAQPRWSGIRVIAVTALAMVGDRDRILEQGFDGYLAKPVDPRTFVPQLLAFLPEGGSEIPSQTKDRAPQLRAEPREPARARSAGRTVLIVDDLLENRALLRYLLESRDFRVLEADSVVEALAALQTERPDLVISDVHMPVARGQELLIAMRSDPQLASIPLVFLSSTVWREQDRTSALELGAVRFLMRPIEPEVLLYTIEQVLADKGSKAADQTDR